MPMYQHHFTPLSPPTTQEENDRLVALGTMTYATNSGYELMVRYLGTDELIRVIAVCVTQEAANHADFRKWMAQIVELSLTAIRLSVDATAEPLHMPDGFLNAMYESDDAEPKFPMVVTQPINPEYRLDIGRVFGAYQAIANRTLAPIAALLAEAQMPALPPHYKVLSLVRAIELLYPDEREREEALDKFQRQFAALAISARQLRNALPEIRNRCAHGKGRGRHDPQPFVGIGYNETTLPPLRHLLHSIIAHGLNQLHALEISGVRHQPDAAA